MSVEGKLADVELFISTESGVFVFILAELFWLVVIVPFVVTESELTVADVLFDIPFVVVSVVVTESVVVPEPVPDVPFVPPEPVPVLVEEHAETIPATSRASIKFSKFFIVRNLDFNINYLRAVKV